MKVIVFDSGVKELAKSGIAWPPAGPALDSLIPSSQWQPHRQSAVCMGNFDGLHPGHQRIVRRAVALAKEQDLLSVALTFPVHPMTILGISRVPLLTTLGEKLQILESLGLDCVFLLPMDSTAAGWTPDIFVERVLHEILRARHCVTGFNFRFGKNRGGDIHTLDQAGSGFGMQVHASKPVAVDSGVISSTMLREWLSQGSVKSYAALMDRPYRIRGRVVSGAGRGRDLGFPTANVQPLDPDKLIPGPGVYWVRVSIEGMQGSYPGAMSLGPNLTFQAEDHDLSDKLEVFVMDLEEDLYGREIEIRFHEKLRDIRCFNDSADLVTQIRSDVERIRQGEADSARGGEAKCQVQILETTNFRYESV